MTFQTRPSFAASSKNANSVITVLQKKSKGNRLRTDGRSSICGLVFLSRPRSLATSSLKQMQLWSLYTLQYSAHSYLCSDMSFKRSQEQIFLSPHYASSSVMRAFTRANTMDEKHSGVAEFAGLENEGLEFVGRSRRGGIHRT